jgi:hypothetical protein
MQTEVIQRIINKVKAMQAERDRQGYAGINLLRWMHAATLHSCAKFIPILLK